VKAEQQKEVAQYQVYRIMIAGELDPSWSEWLGGIRVTVVHDQNGKSVTTFHEEFPDQAALRGVLNKIWDLSLTVLSVTRAHEKDRDNSEEVNYE
jgi:hypothetical protein